MHDLDLIRLGTVQKPSDVAIMHDHDSIAHSEDLRHFGRYHDHRETLPGQFRDQSVNFSFCAHVNAAGGLVEDQDLWRRQQPASNQGLLLVAAAEVLDPLM